MKKISIAAIALISTLFITGCAPANISSDLRMPSVEQLSMKTRCVDFKTGNEDKVNSLLSQYDGWKVLYTSEYTTANKSTTSMVMCFEKPHGQ
ncbi:MAG: hypothetical protein V7745_02875 [Pseudomonadales bacterium]